jgi:hypothetical protein
MFRMNQIVQSIRDRINRKIFHYGIHYICCSILFKNSNLYRWSLFYNVIVKLFCEEKFRKIIAIIKKFINFAHQNTRYYV